MLSCLVLMRIRRHRSTLQDVIHKCFAVRQCISGVEERPPAAAGGQFPGAPNDAEASSLSARRARWASGTRTHGPGREGSGRRGPGGRS